MKVDKMSMAHALEVRVPLLDHPFLEWTARLPATLKLRGGEGKYVFKKALESQLPDDILYRAKMGFAVPLANFSVLAWTRDSQWLFLETVDTSSWPYVRIPYLIHRSGAPLLRMVPDSIISRGPADAAVTPAARLVLR